MKNTAKMTKTSKTMRTDKPIGYRATRHRSVSSVKEARYLMKTRKIVYTLIILMTFALLSVIGASAHGNSNVNVDNTRYQFSGEGRTSTVHVPGEYVTRIISVTYTPATPGARLNALGMPYTVGEYIVTVTYEVRCSTCGNWECTCCDCAHDCDCGETCDCDSYSRCSYDCDCSLPDNSTCCCGYCDYGCDCNCQTTGICTCYIAPVPPPDNAEPYHVSYIAMRWEVPATGDDRVFPIAEIIRAVIMLLVGVGILLLLHGGKGKKPRISKQLAGLALLVTTASFFVPGIAVGANDNNHSISTAEGSVTITPAPLHLIVTLEDKVFSGTTDINIIDVELVGVLGDHRVAVVYNPVAQLAQAKVGENIAVTFDIFRLSGEDAFNYYLYQPNVRGTVRGSGANDDNCGCDCILIDDNDCDCERCTCGYDCNCSEITVTISPRPLTLSIEFADKVYNRDTDVEIISYELLTLVPGFDDVHIELYGNVWLADCCVADDVDVLFNHFELTGSDVSNYIFLQPYGKTVPVLPRPISLNIDIVTQREFIRFYNGAEVLSAEIAGGILPGDEPYVTIGAVDGITAVHTPYDTNGSALVGDTMIVVDIDGDFSLDGERAHNYTVIVNYPANGRITPGTLPGQVTIHNRDSRLRIGSMLYFTNDLPFFTPANFTREWYLDGELVRLDPAGTPLRDFAVTPDHVDSQISLRLVNHDEQYEVWGYVQGTANRYTDYIPYTIVIDNVQSAAVAGVTALGASRSGDRVFFAPGTVANSMMVAHNIASTCPTTGTRTTYANSRSIRNYVDIRWDINTLPSGLGSIYFDNIGAPNTINMATVLTNQPTRYTVNPVDAVDGVISINATFVHRGINLGVANHTFPNANCGFPPPSHTLTVTNIGNAPTNAITVSRTNPTQYNISTATIPSLPIGGSTSVTVSPVAGQFANAPGTTEAATGTRTITSTVTVAGADIVARAANYSMTINHALPSWSGQHGNASHCQRRCTHAACNALHQLTHTMPDWAAGHALNNNVTDSGRCGTRACTRCGNNNTANSHRTHTWGSWGTWGHGDGSNHHRSRSCGHGGCTGAQNSTNFSQHNNAGVRGAHNENITGQWVNHNATHHRRTRNCSVCGRFMRNEDQAHTWSWSAWRNLNATSCTRDRSCTQCGHAEQETEAHAWSWSAWRNLNATSCTRDRSCTRCGHAESETEQHNMVYYSSSIQPDMSTTTVFRCSRCGRTTAYHTGPPGGGPGDDGGDDGGGPGGPGDGGHSCAIHGHVMGSNFSAGCGQASCTRMRQNCSMCGFFLISGSCPLGIYAPINCPICEIPISECEHSCFFCGNETIYGCEWCPHNLPDVCQCGCGWLGDYCLCSNCEYSDHNMTTNLFNRIIRSFVRLWE